ncbi:ATP-binding cassette domain-containing protein [Mycoplasma sp. ES3157-GEN-MYC]|uniref:ATP-binding cassette domain-containing protein n=1 Tax=Mycoplasma miroungigenitalium TaxID=754515 RepID=A0A6M4JFD1_9MOLU|nr:ATP-binding cassette domain-containing protein [Mycoplasma miroungigenitalium]MBU4690629.1 ATP-binding cassette domain-containing protein [Mycoplasma miroungigenitalium]MBU4691896.1 ATP-binding cassette domain-containing protein [Mycoplasma miroungigenitalium]QJR43752.1 ATP-binding cassette domain-containing protein [Mycoplasma miroungigenitalium]
MKKNNSKPILEIQGLKKYFTNGGIVNKAVDDVSFDLHEGEIVGLIGESGSGKTTVGRSLLRLYDDFNGFVMLDGSVISGKRISRNQTKFLRKNIQMIFQDPHASLNGQKNIYTTLKEPLIVNGIVKNQVKDIFKDWVDVKEMYFYTFQHKYKTLRLQNLESINILAKDFFPDWVQKFKTWTFDKSLSFEDNFNSYYSYLEEKQNMESQIVNNLYRNTDELMSFYFEKQQDFRNSNLELDETELKLAKEKYLKTLKLSKITLKQYNAEQKIRVWQSEIKQLIKNRKLEKATNKNTFDNFITEYHKDAIIYRNAKWISAKLDMYLHNIKNQYLSKKLNKVTRQLRSCLKELKYTEVRDVINELEDYSKNFFNNYLLNIKYTPEVKKEILSSIENNFNFNFDKHVQLNTNNLSEFNKKIANLKDKIKVNKSIVVDKQKTASPQQIADAKASYDKAIEVNKAMLAEYVIEHEASIAKLDEKIQEADKQYHLLKDMQTITNLEVMKVHNSFINKLKSYMNDAKAKGESKENLLEIKKSISLYQSKVETKLATLKSFEIEAKYLNRDVKAIKVLLGINTSTAVDSKFVKILKTLSGNIIAKIMIENLLIKTTIYKSLEDVGLLKQFAYRYPHEFSGGQRQRIVIARALITQPKVIVADEPIASLDISIQAQVVNLLKDLCEKKNIGMIFIAHDLSMIEYIADRVQIMHYGKIVESGDTDKVYQKPVHPYTINLFKAIPKISNANEKFENINFELTYLQGQQYPNVPQLFKVEQDHYIYGTKAQAMEWASAFNLSVEQVDAKTIK